jgi:peptidoglycan/LPS O-acetylase OafA/YrhL
MPDERIGTISAKPISASHKLLSLDGLRGISACVVVIYHLHLSLYWNSSSYLRDHLTFLPSILSLPIRAVLATFSDGGFAVRLFWIMSAFVLSLQFFLRAKEASSARAHDYLEDAFLRRYPRLVLPVLASVLFAYLLHSLGWMYINDFTRTVGNEIIGERYTFPPSYIGALKCALWDSFFQYKPHLSYNEALWTMEKEMYGSLFLFGFLGVLGHRSSRFIAYPIMAVVSSWLEQGWLISFIAGIALCDLFVNRGGSLVRSRLSSARWAPVRHNPWVTALVWMLVFVGVGFPRDHRPNSLDLLFGTVAVAMTLISSPTRNILSSRVPVFLGKISFGLYLIHWPVFCSISCWAYLKMSPSTGPQTAAFLTSVITMIVSIGLGYALYLLADRPSLRLSRWVSGFVMSVISTRRFIFLKE